MLTSHSSLHGIFGVCNMAALESNFSSTERLRVVGGVKSPSVLLGEALLDGRQGVFGTSHTSFPEDGDDVVDDVAVEGDHERFLGSSKDTSSGPFLFDSDSIARVIHWLCNSGSFWRGACSALSDCFKITGLALNESRVWIGRRGHLPLPRLLLTTAFASPVLQDI
jgi:hypothetical protein